MRMDIELDDELKALKQELDGRLDPIAATA
jgi:hypothetical protein